MLALRRNETARRVHHCRVSAVHRVGTEDRPAPDGTLGVDHEAAAEARRVAKSFILDLMTGGARDTVGGEAVERIAPSLGREPVENGPTSARGMFGEALHRHVAGGAIVLAQRARGRQGM